jgi:hypothetical protein
VVAKVEWHPGELCPRIGFIVANLARAERIVGFCNAMLMIPDFRLATGTVTGPKRRGSETVSM